MSVWRHVMVFELIMIYTSWLKLILLHWILHELALQLTGPWMICSDLYSDVWSKIAEINSRKAQKSIFNESWPLEGDLQWFIHSQYECTFRSQAHRSFRHYTARKSQNSKFKCYWLTFTISRSQSGQVFFKNCLLGNKVMFANSPSATMSTFEEELMTTD